MDYKRNFTFLSRLVRFSIIDQNSRKKLGKVSDFSASLQQAYPKITGIIAKNGRGISFFIPWKSIKRISMERKIIIVRPRGIKTRFRLSGNEIRLKATFLDRQIVDTGGMKVVRVNDLHFLKENNQLWLVHIDVGTKGLLRRLGWLGFFNAVTRWLMSRDMKDKFIPWKYAQPVGTTGASGALSLKIPSEGIRQIHPADIADILEELGHDERLILFQSLDLEAAARTLQELPLTVRLQIANDIEPKRLSKITAAMDRDEAVDLLAKLPQEKMDDIFDFLPMKTVVELKELLSQSVFSAGSIMNTDYIAVGKGLTAGQVLNRLRKDFIDSESIYYVYLVESDRTLTGVITLRELLRANRSAKVADIMKTNIVKTDINDKLKKTAQLFLKYRFNVIPVTDGNNHLRGVITINDALASMFPELKNEN